MSESEEVEAVRRILAEKEGGCPRTATMSGRCRKYTDIWRRKGFRYDVVRQVIQNSIENA